MPGRPRRSRTCAVHECTVKPYNGKMFCSEHSYMESGAQSNGSSSIIPTTLPPDDEGDGGIPPTEPTARERDLMRQIAEVREDVVAAQVDRDENPPRMINGKVVNLRISLSERAHNASLEQLGALIGQRVEERFSEGGVYDLTQELHNDIASSTHSAVSDLNRAVRADQIALNEKYVKAVDDAPTVAEKFAMNQEYQDKWAALEKLHKRELKKAEALLSPDAHPSGRELLAIKSEILNEELSRFRRFSGSPRAAEYSSTAGKRYLENMDGVYPSSWVEGIPPIQAKSSSSRVSFQKKVNGTPVISVGLGGQSVAIHEVGHIMEENSAQIASASWGVLESHAGQDNGTIRARIDNKSISVVPNGDSPFQKPYVGTLYRGRSDLPNALSSRGTEVFTVGVEHLFLSSDVTLGPDSDPSVQGQNRDVRHRNVILGLLATAHLDQPRNG